MNIFTQLKQNWKAWVSVAMINVPLSISLGVASGATPLQWLLTGIWGWMFAALFASSKFNVFGPAGALAWILLSFSLTTPNGVSLLPYVAIISGICILLIYVFKIVQYITLIPTTALHWFLIWVGISIATGQLNWALWLNIPQSEKIYVWVWETFLHIGNTNLFAFWLFLICFVFLFLAKTKFPKFPAVIFITILWIVIWYMLKYEFTNTGIMLLSDKYTTLSFSPYINIFSWVFSHVQSVSDIFKILKPVISISFIIAIIAILETIVSAQIAQWITKDKYSKQKEVFGLGMANIASWLFGGIPVTAVFVRTSLNIQSWGKSKYASFLIGFFTLIFSLILFNNWFMFLPYPIIAAILINIALGLIDIKHMKEIYAIRQWSFYIAMITAFFTLAEDATFWLVLGTLVALIIYLKRVTTSWAKVTVYRKKQFVKKADFDFYVKNKQQDGDLIVLKFDGWLNYLNQEKNINTLDHINKKLTIVLSFSHMWYLDIDGLETINETSLNLKNKWVDIYFSWLDGVYEKMMAHTKIYKILQKEWKVIPKTVDALHQLLWEDKNKNF